MKEAARQVVPNVINGRPLPDPDRLRECFGYDGKCLFWKVRASKKTRVGDVVTGGSSRYVNVQLDGQLMQAHRVIWAMHYGEWPEMAIDHINGNKHDNRICNLRMATQSQNNANKGAKSTSKTGVKGVCQRAGSRKYIAQIGSEGKNRFIGSFDSLDLAAAAYLAKAVGIYGEYARAR